MLINKILTTIDCLIITHILLFFLYYFLFKHMGNKHIGSSFFFLNHLIYSLLNFFFFLILKSAVVNLQLKNLSTYWRQILVNIL